jgi:hypothetical protein
MDASKEYDAPREWYLKCALKFATEFDGWGGFRLDGAEGEKIARHREKVGSM